MRKPAREYCEDVLDLYGIAESLRQPMRTVVEMAHAEGQYDAAVRIQAIMHRPAEPVSARPWWRFW